MVDDDDDDRLFYQVILCEVAPHHQLVVLTNAWAAIDSVEQASVVPFLIIGELTRRSMTGRQLRAYIDTDAGLRQLATPFVFITHPVYRQHIEKADELTGAARKAVRCSLDPSAAPARDC